MDGDQRPTIPGYELLDALGSRTMGTVYKARQESLNRVVAIRVLPSELGADPIHLERLLAEAQAATLHHANITHVLEVGEHEGVHYLVMEYVSGYSLAGRLKRQKPMTATESLVVAQAVASALQYAWDRGGIIHGDLRPENILVDDDGTVKVSDFLGPIFEKGESHLRTAKISANPYYEYTKETLAQPAPWLDMEALGRVIFHAMTGRPLPGEDAETEIRTAFLQLSQLHPDAATRELAAGLGQLVIQLVCPADGQALDSWSDVSTAVANVTRTPKAAPPPSQPAPRAPAGRTRKLENIESTQVIPNLAAEAAGTRQTKLKIAARHEDLEQYQHVIGGKKKKTSPVVHAIRLLVLAGILAGGWVANEKYHLFERFQAWLNEDPYVEAMNEESDEPAGTDGAVITPAEDPGPTPDPKSGVRADSASPFEDDPIVVTPLDPVAEISAAVMDPIGTEPILATDSFDDQPTVSEFREYLDAMERVFVYSRKRRYDEAVAHLDAWLDDHPNHYYVTSMNENKSRIQSTHALFHLLEDNQDALVGTGVSDGGRKGLITSINDGVIRARQSSKGVDIAFDLEVRALGNSDFIRLLKQASPEQQDQNFATYLLSVCRFDTASEYLRRMTKPRAVKSALVTWEADWKKTWDNVQARRALRSIEADVQAGRMDSATDKLAKATDRYAATDVFEWSDYDTVARLRNDAGATKSDPFATPSTGSSRDRDEPIMEDPFEEIDEPPSGPGSSGNASGIRALGRPPMIELDIDRSKKTRSDEAGDFDDQRQKVMLTVNVINNELEQDFFGLKGEIYGVAVSAADRDMFKVIIREDYTMDIPHRDSHEYETKTVRMLFDDRAWARHGFQYYGYLFVLRDSDGTVVMTKGSKSRLEKHFKEFRDLQEEQSFEM